MINHDLLDKTLHAIETAEAFKAEGLTQDYGWNQASWGRHYTENMVVAVGCHTSFCFAGWACHLAGEALVPRRTGRVVADMAVLDHGMTYSIADRAAELLGLNAVQAGDLFDAGNTLTDLREIVEDLHEGNV